jgi:transcriptional antiterminator RfaH
MSFRRWYLIHTKPCGEALAQENLRRQGFETYLPRVAFKVRRQGRGRMCVAPLFPRYLFLQLEEGRQALSPVRSSVGVSAVVRFGLHYAIVSDEIIEELSGRADPQTGLHHLAARALIPGEPVRVDAGAFEGLSGVFERHAGPDRVVVLLRLLGQEAAVQFPAECVGSGRAA